MADDQQNTPANSSNPPVNGNSQEVSGVSGAQFEEYESPTFDLHAPNPQPAVPPAPAAPPHAPSPAAAPPMQPQQPAIIPDQGETRHDPNVPVDGERVQIGQETIQIAPHPTTNRYPWKSVENPTIPVYGTAVNLAQPQPAPAPAPEPAPNPDPAQAPPQPAPAPTPEPAPTAPEPAPAPEPTEITVKEAPSEPAISLPPPPPTPKAIPPQKHHAGPGHIFSESTQNAWTVLRSGKMRSVFLIFVILAALVGVVFIWRAGGGSLSQLPFVHQLVKQ